jgi:hypothetical protein
MRLATLVLRPSRTGRPSCCLVLKRKKDGQSPRERAYWQPLEQLRCSPDHPNNFEAPPFDGGSTQQGMVHGCAGETTRQA